jgi:hypothetical protein
LQFCEICGYKKGMTTNFFFHLSLLLLFLDPGSGLGKNQDPGSGINIPDPQHCYIVLNCSGYGNCTHPWYALVVYNTVPTDHQLSQ